MCGQEPDASSYTSPVMDLWTTHVTDITNSTESAQDEVKMPPTLMSLAK